MWALPKQSKHRGIDKRAKAEKSHSLKWRGMQIRQLGSSRHKQQGWQIMLEWEVWMFFSVLGGRNEAVFASSLNSNLFLVVTHKILHLSSTLFQICKVSMTTAKSEKVSSAVLCQERLLRCWEEEVLCKNGSELRFVCSTSAAYVWGVLKVWRRSRFLYLSQHFGCYGKTGK